MAHAFPASTFVGSDYHAGSIETARRRAEEAGVADRVRFEVEPAAAFSGEGYDLVTMFDCLHDLGDPVGAARHVLETLAPDGTWMIVEPAAGDRVEDNLNPIGRAFYGFSTLLCTPASLSQDVGLALGAQAGEARLREIVTAAGFTRFRRAAETPFNFVLEAPAMSAKRTRIEVERRFEVSVREGFDYITEPANWPAYWPRFVRLDPASRWRRAR